MDTAAAASEWPDLPADLLRDISERLRDPVDFIRFHAVCKPWRDAAPPSPSPFLPLLLAPGESLWSKPGPLLRSVFSNTAWQAYRVTSSSYKWLSRVDGRGTLLLSTGGYAPDLVDPLTGAVIARLPRFPDEIACYLQSFPDGVVLADGTIVMYVVEAFLKNSGPVLAAVVLRPGDTAWTAVVEPLQTGAYFGIRSTPALVNGEIVLADFLGQCAIKIKLRVAGGVADMIQRECELDDPAGDPVWTPHSYILESRDELLSVHVTYVEGIGEGQWRTAGRAGAVSVSLHALELGPDNGSSPRWVRRDGLSLADRVLFLGHPASFAVDAARLGGAVEGGCAYFVVNWSRHLFWTTLLLPEVCLVYKYSSWTAAPRWWRSCMMVGRRRGPSCGLCRRLSPWRQPRKSEKGFIIPKRRIQGLEEASFLMLQPGDSGLISRFMWAIYHGRWTALAYANSSAGMAK